MIVPAPRRLDYRGDEFTLTEATTLYADPAAIPAATALRRSLSPATGFAFADAEQGLADIVLTVDPVHLPPQGYQLNASASGVEISGGDAAGVFYGVQALRQLLPTEIFSIGRVDRTWSVPGISVEDRPRCGWRGVMLDVTRHFLGKDYVFALLDLLALHRLNVLHLHLNDDQGWRVEIPAHPKLTEVAAWRSETLIGHESQPEGERSFDGTPHGGYFTQQDLREIVEYAAERFIMVVPEIDMPGHMQAVVAAYPELGNTGEPTQVRTHWGISERVLNMSDEAVAFCTDVLTEITELFPAPYVHCGGDEVPTTEWQANPRVQERMRELGLSTERELQTWFTGKIAAFLAERGRRMVGWDEILEGGGPEALPDDVIVMSWRSEAGGITAAKAGLDVVMAPSSHVYFDHYQSERTDNEPLGIGGHTPLEKVYEFDPIPAELRDDEEAAERVLGAQCQLWTEYVPTPEHADYMLFPRVCAFAEAVWRAEPDSYSAFLERLGEHLGRLDALGVHYRPLDKP